MHKTARYTFFLSTHRTLTEIDLYSDYKSNLHTFQSQTIFLPWNNIFYKHNYIANKWQGNSKAQTFRRSKQTGVHPHPEILLSGGGERRAGHASACMGLQGPVWSKRSIPKDGIVSESTDMTLLNDKALETQEVFAGGRWAWLERAVSVGTAWHSLCAAGCVVFYACRQQCLELNAHTHSCMHVRTIKRGASD